MTENKYPTFEAPDKARCFQCDKQIPLWMFVAHINTKFRAWCSSCNMFTYYNVEYASACEISIERLEQIASDMNQEGHMFPNRKFAPVTREENATILNFWQTLSGSSSYYSAVRGLIEKQRREEKQWKS